MPDAFARLLIRLQQEQKIPRSQVSAQALQKLAPLFDAGIIHSASRPGGFVIEVLNPKGVDAFYQRLYPAGAGEEAPLRARAVGTVRNAKRAASGSPQPILLRAVKPAVCIRDGINLDLMETTRQTGAVCLILEAERFWELNCTVAIVENFENFLYFEKMKVPAHIALYSSGRFSWLALRWLSSVQLRNCRFIHCGDYDPVGLSEFMRLKHVLGPRARLFIPPDLARLVQTYGRRELLRDSIELLQNLRKTEEPEVREVIRILNETGCGLEQESLLLSNG